MKFTKIPHALRASQFAAAVLSLILAACSQHSTTTASADSAAAPPATSAPAPSSPAALASTASPTSANAGEQEEADENGTPVAKAQTTSATSDGVHRGPRVKGIQLGDSLDDVKRALTAVLPSSAQCKISADTRYMTCDGRNVISFEFKSGRLINFMFQPYLTDLAFGSMPSKDFVQNFMSAYGVPQMEPRTDQLSHEYLGYRDADGWEVHIYPNNMFDIYFIPTAAQQSGKFN